MLKVKSLRENKIRERSQMKMNYRYLPHDSRPGLVGVGSGRGKREYDLNENENVSVYNWNMKFVHRSAFSASPMQHQHWYRLSGFSVIVGFPPDVQVQEGGCLWGLH